MYHQRGGSFFALQVAMTVLGVALLAYGGYRTLDPTSADVAVRSLGTRRPSLDAELPGSSPSAVTGATKQGRGPRRNLPPALKSLN